VFLGANPARVSYGAQPVSRPLALEEDLAREILTTMPPAQRTVAVVSEEAPYDIRSGTRPRAEERIEPLGIAASRLGPGPRELVRRLMVTYLDRLPRQLAAREAARLSPGELYFAWQGPSTPGSRHYYRLQADDLLIEYDNTTQEGNHQHTVLRRPRSDFGDDVLAAHLSRSHT
jgi:hypothetical protein